MRNEPALIALSLFLVGCAKQNPTPQITEVTRIVKITQAFTPQNTPEPTHAGIVFPADCLTQQPGVDYSPYNMYNIDMIGWCSFIKPSPDGHYLAFSTMTCLSGFDPMLCGEVVKVLEDNSQEAIQVHFIPDGSKRLVWGLDWSSTGNLVIIRTDINQPVDTWVISPPFKYTLNPAAKAKIPGGLKQWNDSRTAFFTVRGNGPGACGGLVSGYDFTSEKVFPDIESILGFDEMSIQVYRDKWWNEESSILLLITPMEYDIQKQDDKFLPTIAGKITLTPSGPEYITIARSDTEDYYFVNVDTGYSVRSKPYETNYCFGNL
jgi:hypothetical protein